MGFACSRVLLTGGAGISDVVCRCPLLHKSRHLDAKNRESSPLLGHVRRQAAVCSLPAYHLGHSPSVCCHTNFKSRRRGLGNFGSSFGILVDDLVLAASICLHNGLVGYAIQHIAGVATVEVQS